LRGPRADGPPARRAGGPAGRRLWLRPDPLLRPVRGSRPDPARLEEGAGPPGRVARPLPGAQARGPPRQLRPGHRAVGGPPCVEACRGRPPGATGRRASEGTWGENPVRPADPAATGGPPGALRGRGPLPADGAKTWTVGHPPGTVPPRLRQHRSATPRSAAGV